MPSTRAASRTTVSLARISPERACAQSRDATLRAAPRNPLSRGNRLAAVQSDADATREPLIPDASLDIDRRPERLPRRREDREGLVPADLDEHAAPILDHLADQVGKPRSENRGRFIAVLVREPRIASDVGDQERPRLRRALESDGSQVGRDAGAVDVHSLANRLARGLIRPVYERGPPLRNRSRLSIAPRRCPGPRDGGLGEALAGRTIAR